MTTHDNTLDIHAAGAIMNVHPKTVLELIGDGTLPAGRVGRAYVLLKRDVLNYVESIIVKQTAERMGAPKRRSPHRVGQKRSANVGIAT